MAILAAEHRAAFAPVSVERAVLAEFEAVRRRRVWRMAAAGAVAALLVGGVVLIGEKPVRHSAVAVEPQLSQRVPLPHNSAATVETRRSFPSVRVPGRESPKAVRSPCAILLLCHWLLRSGLQLCGFRFASAIAAIGFPLPAIDPGNVVEADCWWVRTAAHTRCALLDRSELMKKAVFVFLICGVLRAQSVVYQQAGAFSVSGRSIRVTDGAISVSADGALNGFGILQGSLAGDRLREASFRRPNRGTAFRCLATVRVSNRAISPNHSRRRGSDAHGNDAGRS